MNRWSEGGCVGVTRSSEAVIVSMVVDWWLFWLCRREC